MERVEPVPAGIIEDAVVVGCAAFREDAGADLAGAAARGDFGETTKPRARERRHRKAGRGRRCRIDSSGFVFRTATSRPFYEDVGRPTACTGSRCTTSGRGR